MATHDVHQSSDGIHRWVDGCGGLYRHDNQFVGAPRDEHPEQSGGEFIPLPMVVLRCRCDDPLSHAEKGEHCPDGEIDVGTSYYVSTTFQPTQR